MALAHALGMKYREGLVKNRYIGRTFIMGSNRARQASIRLKLNTIQLEFEGKDVLLVDDSIVRGNTSRRSSSSRAARARARSTSRPCRRRCATPCVYGIDMSTKNEFVAKDRSPEEVAEAIGADGVVYQTLENLIASVPRGQPADPGHLQRLLLGRLPHRRRDGGAARAHRGRAARRALRPGNPGRKGPSGPAGTRKVDRPPLALLGGRPRIRSRAWGSTLPGDHPPTEAQE
jgi:hypothetical protein